MSDYADALWRAQVRIDEGKISGRARRILRAIGWDASEEQIRLALQTDNLSSDKDVQDDVVARARELQNERTANERHYSREEIDQMQDKQQLDREAIREYVRGRRADDPNATVPVVMAEVCKKFKLNVGYANFYATYWKKAGPVKPARVAAQPTSRMVARAEKQQRSLDAGSKVKRIARRAKRSTNGLVPVAAVASQPAAVAVNGAEAGVEVGVAGPAILQVLPLKDGRLRFQLDTDFDLASVLGALAAVLVRPQPSVAP